MNDLRAGLTRSGALEDVPTIAIEHGSWKDRGCAFAARPLATPSGQLIVELPKYRQLAHSGRRTATRS